MRNPVVLLPLAALIIAGCHRSDDRQNSVIGSPLPPANTPMAPGEVRIASGDGTMLLGIARDTVYMRFSDSLQKKLAHDLDTNTNKSDDFGATIERMVKRNVGKLLNRQIAYPVADIQDVRYENGEIKFEYRDKHALSFEDIKQGKESVLHSFNAADAGRFVAAVKAAKSAR